MNVFHVNSPNRYGIGLKSHVNVVYPSNELKPHIMATQTNNLQRFAIKKKIPATTRSNVLRKIKYENNIFDICSH